MMVTSKPTQWAEVDEQGRLVLPPGMAAHFGLTPGARLRLEDDDGKVRLHRPLTHLARIYVEPTIYCNLDCITCLRNVWDERLGRMKPATFDRILEGIRAVEPRPLVFFGGIGEPLFHPQLADMVARTKALGATVELITNGTLLNDKKARELIEAGLDVIWISIDGATPESYADVRLGAELPHVLENIVHLRQIRPGGHHPQPKIGIAFVAMKRNIKDLPAVLNLARRLGASFFKVSNVLPY
ncbi:MAG: radical SAM protein, partial [Anaerolineae bacterium]